MAFTVGIERTAIKALQGLPASEQKKITKRLHALAEDPRPVGVTKLSGAEGYRVRSGDYRIVYLIDDAAETITVTRIGHRRDIYRRM